MTKLITRINLEMEPNTAMDCNIEHTGEISEYRDKLVKELKERYNITATVNITYKTFEE